VRRVVLAHRKESAVVPPQPEASSPAVSFTPASVQAGDKEQVPVEEDNDSGVDVATIRRMLRPSPEGRSPFQR
jgi:hypothetical protein